MTIAFTGATGQLGTLVAQELLKRTSADQLVALVRDPAKAENLAGAGIDVRKFDYDEPEGLTSALQGIDRLLLISGNAVGQRVPQHTAVIEAATAADVGFVAYTSFLHTDTTEINAVAPEHVETEKLLAAAPFDVALLRNGWYIENFADRVAQAVDSGTLIGSANDGRISGAARNDFAEAAAVVLTAEDATDATYELAGDEAFTLADLAKVASTVSGKPVEYRNVPTDEYRAALTDAGTPPFFVDFLATTDESIAAGELEDPKPGTLSHLIGRPTTPVAEIVAGWTN